MSEVAKIVGAKIRELRQQMGLSREVCAERAGISSTFLADIERGRKEPSLQTLLKLSQALAIPIREIIAGIETELPEGVTHLEMLLRISPLLKRRMDQAEAEALYSVVRRTVGEIEPS